MMSFSRLPLVALAILALDCSVGPARAETPGLKLAYGSNVQTLSAAEIAALPHQSVSTVDGHDKKTHTYSGIPVRDLLARVGVAFGDKLRGRQLRLAVVARSADGYAVTFALAEFDPAFRPTTILLVDGEDGGKLNPNVGPFRLVAPGDERPARWARMVTALDVVAVGDER